MDTSGDTLGRDVMAADVVLVGESKEGTEQRLNKRRLAMEGREMK